MTLNELTEILDDHFRAKARDITRFAGTGYSFEEWFNWELFSMLTARSIECSPKPNYKTYFTGHATSRLGDIAFQANDGSTWLIETSLVHAYTLNKWRKKIFEDRKKLQEAIGQGIRKVQLMLLCNDVETNLQTEWAYWFQGMPFWAEPDGQKCFSDGEQGEVCLLLWEVK